MDDEERLKRMSAERAAIRARTQDALQAARERVATLESLAELAVRADVVRGHAASTAMFAPDDVDLLSIRTDGAEALHRELVLVASRVFAADEAKGDERKTP